AAWRRSYDLVLAVYDATDSFPKNELYGLTSQTRRAGFSVVANIAEGSAKRGGREFARYLDIALGSLTEIEVALRLARDRGYVTNERWAKLDACAITPVFSLGGCTEQFAIRGGTRRVRAALRRPPAAPLPPPCRPLPPSAALCRLVGRWQFLIPLQQLRLPALERDLLAPNQHVLHTRRELERVSRPDDHVRHLPRLERAVAVRHSEDLRRRQRHGAQRLVPGHAVGDGVPRLLAQVARLVRVGLEQRDLHAGLRHDPRVSITDAQGVVTGDV